MPACRKTPWERQVADVSHCAGGMRFCCGGFGSHSSDSLAEKRRAWKARRFTAERLQKFAERLHFFAERLQCPCIPPGIARPVCEKFSALLSAQFIRQVSFRVVLACQKNMSGKRGVPLDCGTAPSDCQNVPQTRVSVRCRRYAFVYGNISASFFSSSSPLKSVQTTRPSGSKRMVAGMELMP